MDKKYQSYLGVSTSKYYLNGEEISLENYIKILLSNYSSLDGKIMEIDGRKYKLTEIKEIEKINE